MPVHGLKSITTYTPTTYTGGSFAPPAATNIDTSYPMFRWIKCLDQFWRTDCILRAYGGDSEALGHGRKQRNRLQHYRNRPHRGGGTGRGRTGTGVRGGGGHIGRNAQFVLCIGETKIKGGFIVVWRGLRFFSNVPPQHPKQHELSLLTTGNPPTTNHMLHTTLSPA